MIEMRRSFWVRGRGWGRRGATRNWGEDGNGLHLVLGGGYTGVHKCQTHTSERLICVLVTACTRYLNKTQAQSPEATPEGFHNIHYSLTVISGTLGDACVEPGTDVDVRC